MRRREGWGVGLTPGLSPKGAASDLKPYPSAHGELELGSIGISTLRAGGWECGDSGSDK